MIGQPVDSAFPVSRVVTLRGGGDLACGVDGWVTSVQRLCFSHVQHFGLTSGDARPRTAHCSRRWSVRQSISQPGLVCHCAASSARQAWGHPRVLDAACVKTRGVLALFPPGSLYPRHPPSDRAAGVSLSSSRLVQLYQSLYPLPTASLAWIGARLPGCEFSPKHGDIREPGMAAALIAHGTCWPPD